MQQRVTEQESYQLEAVQEKPFTFSEQVRLNVGQGEPVQLAACRAVPLCVRAVSSAASCFFKGARSSSCWCRRPAAWAETACPGEPPLFPDHGGPGAGRGGRVPHGGGADPAELPARRGGRPHRGGGAGPAGPGPGVEPPPGHPPPGPVQHRPPDPGGAGGAGPVAAGGAVFPHPERAGAAGDRFPAPQRDGQLGVPWARSGETGRGTSWCWRERPGSPSSIWTKTTPSRPSRGL